MAVRLQVIVLVSFLGLCSCQVISRGGCPDVKVVENFDLNKYAGRWYEMERFFAIFQPFIHCTTAEYTIIPPSTVMVNNTGFSKLTGMRDSIIGDAKVMDEAVQSKLGVSFGEQLFGNYWVLSTDYTTYSVVWSCVEEYMGILGKLNTQLAWILTRRPEGISDTQRDELIQMMNDQGIKTDAFLRITQNDCPER